MAAHGEGGTGWQTQHDTLTQCMWPQVSGLALCADKHDRKRVLMTSNIDICVLMEGEFDEVSKRASFTFV